jgi:hypothetical protein
MKADRNVSVRRAARAAELDAMRDGRKNRAVTIQHKRTEDYVGVFDGWEDHCADPECGFCV